MKYRVRHTSTYRYSDPVDLSAHILHLSPRSLPGQRVLVSELSASPVPSRRREGTDHFGNQVTWMFVDQPHSRFEVTVNAVVDVAFAAVPEPAATPPWEAVATAARASATAWQVAEFLYPSPMVSADHAATAFAAASFPPMRPVLAGLRDLSSRIRREFKFRPGTTTIATPVGRVLSQRAGVCQDFAHLMIAGLRSLGLPARYVSGYIRTHPPAGQAPRRGADQSHAWVGCWLGERHGWVDLDPTNDVVVKDEHVVLAWGRDYGDISPTRGVILGGGDHNLLVAVDLETV